MAALAQLGLSTAQGLAGGIEREGQLEFEATQREIEADRLDEHSAEIVRAGNKQVATYSEKVQKFAAASEAAIARKNIDLGSGLAQAIKDENSRIASLDILAMKNQVTNAVLNNQYRGSQLRRQAEFDRDAASGAVLSGLITGAAKGAVQYGVAKYKQKQLDDLKKALQKDKYIKTGDQSYYQKVMGTGYKTPLGTGNAVPDYDTQRTNPGF